MDLGKRKIILLSFIGLKYTLYGRSHQGLETLCPIVYVRLDIDWCWKLKLLILN